MEMDALYAESSAVLHWLLGTPKAAQVQKLLADARIVASSALTPAEVGRTLRRLAASGEVEPEDRDRAWARFCAAAAHWQFYAVTDAVLSRVAEPFPDELLRTLDAIHLATALRYSAEVRPLAMLSLDRRIRDNARELRLAVAPGA